MSVSRRLRFEILKRDSHACRYCGAMAPGVPLTVDHVIPVALGGGDEPSNLVTACKDCNAGKSSVHPDSEMVADVDATAMLFAKAVERATEIQREEIDAAAVHVQSFYDKWEGWTYEVRVDGKPERRMVPLDPDWEDSVTRWLTSGLTIDDLYELTDRAMNKAGVPAAETFRYFAGCCWGRLSDRQELARKLIEDGVV